MAFFNFYFNRNYNVIEDAYSHYFNIYKLQHKQFTIVGSQIVAHTLVETGNGPNRPNTIDL